MRVAVVGGGWNGCHIALELRKEGHKVSLFEKESDIFKGVSGNFGIRLHKGPHYPRSKATRDSCRDAFEKFCKIYPDLVVPHHHAIYALGDKDALGNNSKVPASVFHNVCHESPECEAVDPETFGYKGLVNAFNLDEPSVVIGNRLRAVFRQKLGQASVQLHLNAAVDKVVNDNEHTKLYTSDGVYACDAVINATAYQSLLPKDIVQDLPVDIGVTYQTCIALVYEDQTPSEKPFSFIVMDGWFPCIMPAIEEHTQMQKNYIATHGSYTILGSFDSHSEGQQLLDQLTEDDIVRNIKPHLEREITRFWPGFLDRFTYQGWKGNVLAKLKTTSEFRSSLTFEKDRVIHIFPGKVSNVVTAAEEVIPLINDIASRQKSSILSYKGVRFTLSSAFSKASHEIRDKPAFGEHHTSNLQTYASLIRGV